MTLDQKLRVAAREMHDFGSTLSVPGLTDTARTGVRRSSWAIALAGAAVVIAAISMVIVLAPAGVDDDVIGEPVPTSVPVPTPTTVPPTTTPPSTTTPAAPGPEALIPVAPTAIEWTRIESDSFEGDGGYRFLQEVTAGGPGLVAVGADCPGVCANWQDASDADWAAAVWTSTDGRQWTRVPHDETVFGGTGDQVMLDVTAGENGLLVGVGYDDPAFRPGPFDSSYDGPDRSGAVWISPDGIAWQRVDDPRIFGGPGDQLVVGVVSGGPGFVAVGADEGRAVVWVSPDGRTWRRVDDTSFAAPDETQFHDIAIQDGLLVAVGIDFNEVVGDEGGVHPNTKDNVLNLTWERGAVWTSVDGLQWTRVDPATEVFGGFPEGHADPRDPTGGPSYMWTVTAIDDGFVAGGIAQFDRAIWYSSDGTHWERIADSDERWDGGKVRSGIETIVTDGTRFSLLGWDGSRVQVAWPETSRYPTVRFYGWEVPTRNMVGSTMFEDRPLAVGFDGNDAAVWIGEWVDEGS